MTVMRQHSLLPLLQVSHIKYPAAVVVPTEVLSPCASMLGLHCLTVMLHDALQKSATLQSIM